MGYLSVQLLSLIDFVISTERPPNNTETKRPFPHRVKPPFVVSREASVRMYQLHT